MSKIMIYKQEYDLPNLFTRHFKVLHEQIRRRHKTIRDGRRDRVSLFGLFKRDAVPMSLKEQYDQLEFLVRDYDAIIEQLKLHHHSYELFFIRLADEINDVVSEKCSEILKVETDRLELEVFAEKNSDKPLLETVRSQKEQLLRSIRLLGRSTLLILRKMDLFKESLKRLSEDHDTQRKVLERLQKRLNLHVKAFVLQEKIKKIESDVARIAHASVNFEQLMHEYLAPFQEIIDEVTNVDSKLIAAVEDIKCLTDIILHHSDTPVNIEELDSEETLMLDFLIKSRVKRGRLVQLLSSDEFSGDDSQVLSLTEWERGPRELSIESAISNLLTFLEFQLPGKDENGEIRQVQSADNGKISLAWWYSLDHEWMLLLKKAVEKELRIGRLILDKVNRALLEEIGNLTSLDCSGTSFDSLEPIGCLKRLKILDCRNTEIESLEPLRFMRNLRVMNCSSTPVMSLAPLRVLRKLRFVDCTKTRIPREDIEAFVKANPKCKVVF
ncbi:leucine-rich repeat domain-containing protein [Acidobacteriota bacterium]